MNDLHVREELGAYVLGALEPARAETVRLHLRSCSVCASEHARLAGLPALLDLARSAEDALVPPSPELEEAVLDRYAESRRGQRRRGARAASPWRKRGLRLERRWRPGLAGALAGAALALSAVAGLDALEEPGPEPIDVALRPVAPTPGAAEATLEFDRRGTAVELQVDSLPPTRPGEEYHLWIVKDGRRVDAGGFQVGRDGEAEIELRSDVFPDRYGQVGITRQPDRTDLLVGRLPS